MLIDSAASSNDALKLTNPRDARMGAALQLTGVGRTSGGATTYLEMER